MDFLRKKFRFGRKRNARPTEEAAQTSATASEPTAMHPPSPPRAQVEQQMPAVPASLPSQVDMTLAECPKFRIVLVGNSGVGKSSLIRNIFNIDPDKIDVAHGRAGKANIDQEYTSPVNPRFILHDSKGFEAGSKVNWDTVEKFLRSRWKRDLPGRIHAIWFCVETPLKGGRLLQTGDERLLQLAKEFNIPIIAVFTKYDQLVTQFWRQDNQPGKSEQKRDEDAEKKASDSFGDSVNELQKEWKKPSVDLSISCVKVSTEDPNAPQTLIDLTTETRIAPQDVEEKLQVLWVAAQQVNARQKVEVSISEGFKKYWRDLGQSSAFEHQILIDCIQRIHDDVLKVWNFNDSAKILSGINFFTEMIGLLKPSIDDHVKGQNLTPVPAYGKSGAVILQHLLDSGFSHQAVHYLYDTYKPYPSTGRLLAAYIINLVLVLYKLFGDILPHEPPRDLKNDLVFEKLKSHKDHIKDHPLDKIDIGPENVAHPKRDIEHIIGERLELWGIGNVAIS